MENQEELSVKEAVELFKRFLKLTKKNTNIKYLELGDFKFEERESIDILRFTILYELEYNDENRQYIGDIEKMVDMIYSFGRIGVIKPVPRRWYFSYDITRKDDWEKEHGILKENAGNQVNVTFAVKSKINRKKLKIVKDFIKFINDKLTLNGNVLIELKDKKDSNMTTGVREKKHHIKILCKNRMLVDILRTVAHEWVHEYQHQKMKITDTQRVKQVGGWVENHANAMSGILLKRYIKNNKDLENELF